MRRLTRPKKHSSVYFADFTQLIEAKDDEVARVNSNVIYCPNFIRSQRRGTRATRKYMCPCNSL